MTAIVPDAVWCALVVLALLAGGGVALQRRARLPALDAPVAATTLASVLVLAETMAAVICGGTRGWMAVLLAAGGAAAALWWRGRLRDGANPERARAALVDRGAGAATGTGTRRLLWLGALGVVAPLWWLPVPLDTDAQGFGHLALAVREGGTLSTLAPWRPGLTYLYAPGVLVLFARVSSWLPWMSMADVMLGAGHAFAFAFVWIAGTAAAEFGLVLEGHAAARSSHWRAAGVVAAFASLGYWTALADAHYTSTITLVFATAWAAGLLRAWRTGARGWWAWTGLMLAAVVVSHQDTAIDVALGLVPLAVAALWPSRVPAAAGGMTIMAGVTLALLAPWLATLPSLVASGVASPFPRSLAHWKPLLLYHGLAWPAVAVAGLMVWRRCRWAWACGIWVALVADFAVFGVVERVAPWLAAPITRFDFPFGLGWHGPIVPYLLLGAGAMAWAATRARIDLAAHPSRAGAVVLLAIVVAALVAFRSLADASRERVEWHGAFATRNDVEALRWIRDHTPPGARLLNYPGDHEALRDWEGHWAPVVAERDSVYFRMQPFFLSGPAVDAASSEQRALLAFWRDPRDEAHAAALEARRIAFVVVPEVVNDPGAGRRWRGAPPALLPGVVSRPADAPYLRKVFAAGGAEVYAFEGRPR